MASQVLKRKALPAKQLSSKKCRRDPSNLGEESDFTEPSNSDSSGDESQEDIHQIGTDAQTPLTPISDANSPQVPSNCKTIRCTYTGCTKTFNRQAKLIQHLNSHTNTRPFVCPHNPCPKAFFRSSHLKHHVKSAHSDKRDYVCQWDRCGKSFVTSTRLKRHEELHNKRQQFACTFPGCGQEFRKHNTLQKHIAVVHEGKRKPFVCDQQDHNGTACGASFDIEGNLRNHVNSVHSGRNYYCTICLASDTSYPTLLALQAHIRTDHPPACHECGSQFANNDTLEQHIEAKHSNLDLELRKKYPCIETGCGRSFTSKSNLNKHIRQTHEEARSFVCGMVDPTTLMHVDNWDGSNACGRALSSKYNLIGHIRTVHLGLDRLKRSDREDKERGSNGTTLMRLTGIGYEAGRQIECPVQDCDHRFPRDYDLHRHLQSFHDLETANIDHNQQCSDVLNQQAQRGSSSLHDTDALELESETRLPEDYFDRLEYQATVGGSFWLGGQDVPHPNSTAGEEGLWNSSGFAISDGHLADHGLEVEGSTALDPRLI